MLTPKFALGNSNVAGETIGTGKGNASLTCASHVTQITYIT